MSVNEKMAEADRQKTMPTSEKPVSTKSWKYLMEMTVRTRSLMFDTLAFSKGEIFMLIVLAASGLSYRYILRRMRARQRRAG